MATGKIEVVKCNFMSVSSIYVLLVQVDVESVHVESTTLHLEPELAVTWARERSNKNI